MTKDDIQLLSSSYRWANTWYCKRPHPQRLRSSQRDLGAASLLCETRSCTSSRRAGLATCWKEPSPSSTFVKDYWQATALFNPNALLTRCGAVKVGGNRERKSRFESRNERILGKDASVYAKQSVWCTSCNIWRTFHLPRGQVSLMMRQLAAGPVATDFALF